MKTGRRIKTLARLKQLVDKRKSVTCPKTECFRGPIPAAFMFNLQGGTLHNLFQSGMYEYKRKTK